MTDSTSRTPKFAALFESITGKSTITERQSTAVPIRLDDSGEADRVSTYLRDTSAAHGFDDVIDDPELY